MAEKKSKAEKLLRSPEETITSVERPVLTGGAGDQARKKNYAEKLSRSLAECFAHALRDRFPDIRPDSDGNYHESRARGAFGVKKLDVNASTPEYGLALGLSIKTLNFPDAKPGAKDKSKDGRYTKNLGRIANELRAEAMDYHVRQPFAVMVAVVFLPMEACDDGTEKNASSFGSAVQKYRPYSSRPTYADNPQSFERFFIGLYELDGKQRCSRVSFFDVQHAPPRARRPNPKEVFSYEEVLREILSTFDDRNDPPFVWADD